MTLPNKEEILNTLVHENKLNIIPLEILNMIAINTEVFNLTKIFISKAAHIQLKWINDEIVNDIIGKIYKFYLENIEDIAKWKDKIIDNILEEKLQDKYDIYCYKRYDLFRSFLAIIFDEEFLNIYDSEDWYWVYEYEDLAINLTDKLFEIFSQN